MNPVETRALCDGLSCLLADTYVLYLKTHNFHWNVKGPLFHSLHLLFETQYTELALAVDLIAERIRALGHPAPGTYTAYLQMTALAETPGVPSANSMVQILKEDNAKVGATATKYLSLTDSTGDAATADLLTQRKIIHDKAVWMLGSLLET